MCSSAEEGRRQKAADEADWSLEYDIPAAGEEWGCGRASLPQRQKGRADLLVFRDDTEEVGWVALEEVTSTTRDDTAKAAIID